jgi:hypothetical protein
VALYGCERGNPQTWNRYVYVLNNPLRLIDPNGLDDAEANEQDKQKQVVKPLEDKIIQKRLKDIQSNGSPLPRVKGQGQRQWSKYRVNRQYFRMPQL